jgi:hypothetical protein
MNERREREKEEEKKKKKEKVEEKRGRGGEKVPEQHENRPLLFREILPKQVAAPSRIGEFEYVENERKEGEGEGGGEEKEEGKGGRKKRGKEEKTHQNNMKIVHFFQEVFPKQVAAPS